MDRALDQAWETLAKRRSSPAQKLGRYGSGLRALAELQLDNATLFEGVNNALKLSGDQYLARVYRTVSRRFHLDDWDAGILRKLGTLDSICQKMSDQASARRMEVLEWLVIILIAFSILLQLLPLASLPIEPSLQDLCSHDIHGDDAVDKSNHSGTYWHEPENRSDRQSGNKRLISPRARVDQRSKLPGLLVYKGRRVRKCNR